MTGIPGVTFGESIAKYSNQILPGACYGILSAAERGPVSEDDGGPAILRSSTDVDRWIGRETSTLNVVRGLKHVIKKGAEIHFIRVCGASAAKATKVLLDGSSANALRVTATSSGAWGNSVLLTVTSNAQDGVNYFDLAVAYANQPELNAQYYHLSMDPSRGDFVEAVINGVDALIKVEALSTTRPANGASVALVGGVSDDAPSASAFQTAMAEFNGDKLPTLLAAYTTDGEVLADGVAYCDDSVAFGGRGDLAMIHCGPSGLTPSQIVDYRHAAGGYGHTDIDSTFAALYFPDVAVRPDGSYGVVNVPALFYILGQFAQTEKQAFQWFATAGSDRGWIREAVGVRTNVLHKTDHATLVAAQINPVVFDRAMGKVMIWDNWTLGKNMNDPRKFLNVRRAIIWVKKRFDLHSAEIMFEPNDPASWKQQHARMLSDLLYMQENRGITGTKDEPGFRYVGDQEAATVDQARFNSPVEISDGKYKARIYAIFTPALREISLTVTASKSATEWTEE